MAAVPLLFHCSSAAERYRHRDTERQRDKLRQRQIETETETRRDTERHAALLLMARLEVSGIPRMVESRPQSAALWAVGMLGFWPLKIAFCVFICEIYHQAGVLCVV